MSAWAAFWTKLEFDRFGYGTALMLLVFCTGALTMAFGGGEYLWRLIITAVSSMALLVGFLVLLPLRALANITLVALTVNIVYVVLMWL